MPCKVFSVSASAVRVLRRRWRRATISVDTVSFTLAPKGSVPRLSAPQPDGASVAGSEQSLGEHLTSRCARNSEPRPAIMRTLVQLSLVAVSFCALIGAARCCDNEPARAGFKIVNKGCVVGYGCASEYPYRNKRECMLAYRERDNNICNHAPCVRGTCLQVNQSPGYACRCEGTGYYGQRCERACPTTPERGYTYPLECIVI